MYSNNTLTVFMPSIIFNISLHSHHPISIRLQYIRSLCSPFSVRPSGTTVGSTDWRLLPGWMGACFWGRVLHFDLSSQKWWACIAAGSLSTDVRYRKTDISITETLWSLQRFEFPTRTTPTSSLGWLQGPPTLSRCTPSSRKCSVKRT